MMNFQFSKMIIGLLLLSIVMVFCSSRCCLAYPLANSIDNVTGDIAQPPEDQDQPSTAPAAIPPQSVESPSIDSLIKTNVNLLAIYLDKYQAAATGELSVCGGDEECLKHAKRIQAWFCTDAVCKGTDTSKKPLDCFIEKSLVAQDSYPDTRDQINLSLCPLITTPNSETRQNLLIYVPDAEGDELVRHVAHIFALKGSAVLCEQHIKDYVGAYGPQWNHLWYEALSGCRILAKESTPKQEEKDFYTWHGVWLKTGKSCSDIVSSELRSACSTPGTGEWFLFGDSPEVP